jgi:hypothetical protein
MESKMKDLRISAKNMAEVALPDFCPRCFWIRLHCENKLPYQIFPGIFSSIDSYSKKVTNIYFKQHFQTPSWFAGFGELGRPVKAPHHSKFSLFYAELAILLTGVPDEIFQSPDGSYFIIDYKTAKFTGTQDRLLPMYEAQLNAYAYIGENIGFSPVKGLGLIYYEPITDLTGKSINSFIFDQGFSMHFSAKLLEVKLDPDQVPLWLSKVREIYDLGNTPPGIKGCKNCDLLDRLLKVVQIKPEA